MMRYNIELVNAIGNLPNLEMPVISGNHIWTTIANEGGYICQTSISSNLNYA